MANGFNSPSALDVLKVFRVKVGLAEDHEPLQVEWRSVGFDCSLSLTALCEAVSGKLSPTGLWRQGDTTFDFINAWKVGGGNKTQLMNNRLRNCTEIVA